MGSLRSSEGNRFFIDSGNPFVTDYPPAEAAATTIKMYGSGFAVVQSKSAVLSKRKVLLVALWPMGSPATGSITICNYEGNQPVGSEYEGLSFAHATGAPRPPAEINLELRNGLSAKRGTGTAWMIVYRQLDEEASYKLPTA